MNIEFKKRNIYTPKLSALFLVVGLFTSCSQHSTLLESDNTDLRSAEDLYIVDCLLPSQVRKLGTMSYLGPRRPTRTTANDCEIRGGEYVSYDRSDYRTALKVWLEQAEAGDADAQNYVGEIFEKGLGQEPDYVSAVAWYTKSADQGNTRAAVNLGYLFEKGLGVEKDVAKALNLYRKASGIADDDLIFDSTAQAEIKKARDELDKKVASANLQTDYLKKQIAQLETKIASQPEESVNVEELAQAKREIAALKELYGGAEQEREKLAEQLSSINVAYRNIERSPLLSPEKIQVIDERKLKNVNFGRYFAVIIGNQDYRYIENLRSPLHDAEKLKSVLENNYGFTVLMLPNADEKIILNTLNNLSSQLTEKDNLLIYYAGHGDISTSAESSRERGYWLPIDAQRDNISNWINNTVISDHLDRLNARSILVVADSCYAGQLGVEGSSFLFGSGAKLSERSIQTGLAHRSRIVISSGGIRPVLDGTDQDHSVFASSLLGLLENNKQILQDSMLFSQLSVNVRNRNKQLLEGASVPEMKPIRSAGHEGGAFYFVPNIN